MKKITARAFFILVFVSLAGRATADPVLIGGSANGHNCFPFGCGRGLDAPATRYQQVYNSALFDAPIRIAEIQFFHTLGNSLNRGEYLFYFSTTAQPVDGLDTTNFDRNVGADRALFSAMTLGGEASAILSITGTPFLYNPRLGNLLLDIVIPGALVAGGSYFQAHNGTAAGVFSRAHNFGAGMAGYGLTTRFVDIASTAPIPEPTTISLLGGGLIATLVRARKARRQARSARLP